MGDKQGQQQKNENMNTEISEKKCGNSGPDEGHLLDKGVWCAMAEKQKRKIKRSQLQMEVYCGKTNTTQLFEHLKKKLCFHLHSQSEALRRVMQQG